MKLTTYLTCMLIASSAVAVAQEATTQVIEVESATKAADAIDLTVVAFSGGG